MKNHGNIMEFCQSEKVGTLTIECKHLHFKRIFGHMGSTFHKCLGTLLIGISKRWRSGMGGVAQEEAYAPKYIDHFLTVLLETFTTGFVFVTQSKQGVLTLCFDQNYALP